MADDASGTGETGGTSDRTDGAADGGRTAVDGSPDPGSRDATTDGAATDATDGPDARSVVVPSRVYKAVTVFSTLFAVVTVVGGFVVLDVATKRATLSLSQVDPLQALAGIALIVAGAVTYAFSTRFRAEGMGNAKDDTDESTNNG